MQSFVCKLFLLLWISWCALKMYLFGAFELLKQLIYSHNKAQDLPLKTGKVAIVTGGDAGMGYEISKGLVSKNVHVIIACRCLTTGNIAKSKIREDYPNAKIDVMELDLASLKSIKKFVDSFIGRSLPLHILINNAGVMFCPYMVTEDGLEYHFQVNYLGHLYLTHLLLRTLKESGTDNSSSRIINVSSSVHFLGSANFDRYSRHLDWWEYSPHQAYSDSKLAVVMATYRLHLELSHDKSHVTVNTLHPGVVNTNLFRHQHWSIKWLFDIVGKLTYKYPEQGADVSLYLALSENMEGESTGYYDNSYKCDSSALSYDEELQDDLWTKSFQIIDALTRKQEEN